VTVAAQEKRYYMACLDLEGRDVLVVGAGSVALEKIEGLLEVGARVTVVAPAVSEPVQALARAGRIALHRGVYRAQALDGRFLVVAATSTTSVNEQVYADAAARGMRCNVVDVPELCSFILPAVHRADPIAVAISPGRVARLAQRIRDDVARSITHEHARLARELRGLAPGPRATSPPTRRVATSSASSWRSASMTVTLVGAGPGDPGLITVRGLERLRACDAVVYDRLVAPELVDERRPTPCARAENLSQAEVDELLVRLGREGLDVAPMGGDPSAAGAGRRPSP
jgi:siroheme synthase-like protein